MLYKNPNYKKIDIKSYFTINPAFDSAFKVMVSNVCWSLQKTQNNFQSSQNTCSNNASLNRFRVNEFNFESSCRVSLYKILDIFIIQILFDICNLRNNHCFQSKVLQSHSSHQILRKNLRNRQLDRLWKCKSSEITFLITFE